MRLSNINKEIMAISMPAIIANIAEPLLGLLDTGIAGHLGAPQYIGAVAVGAMMMNVLYWNFGFLRMGTSGLTAQAYGSGSRHSRVMVSMLLPAGIWANCGLSLSSALPICTMGP